MALSDNTDDPASAAPHSSSSSSSRSNNTNKITTWRENSSKQKVEDHATKYHLQSSMPKDFVYTNEEKGLLQMYDTTKTFEREVIRLKEKKAREHIYAATAAASAGDDDDEQNANNAAVAKKKKRKKKAAAGTAVPGMNDVDAMMSSSEEDDDDLDDDEYDSDDNNNNNNNKKKKYSAEDKLKALREEIEEKKFAKLQENDAKETEERMRNELLAKNNDGMDGVSQPLLKRKKFNDDGSTLSPTRDGQSGTGVPSLLSKMIPKQTPPHEFSEKLEFVPWKGKILFPVSPDDEPKWTPSLDYKPKNPNDGAFLVALEDFDITKAVNGEGPNTIAIKFQGPIDSKRFSFNIAGPNHNDFDSVLFHFNPRPREKVRNNNMTNYHYIILYRGLILS
jgi:hypothetical protein